MNAEAWNRAAPTLALALRAINGAFAQADARLVEAQERPMWDAAAHGFRLDLKVEVAGEVAANLGIAVTAQAINMIAHPAGASRNGLERRRSLPLSELTVPRLAEAVAACAWPSVAGRAGQRRA